MKKASKIIGWSVGFSLVLAAAAWFYVDSARQKEQLEQAGLSLESGIALFNQKNYGEALEVLESIPAGAPEEWRVRYYQGSCYIRMKDYQSAVDYLEQALALNTTETSVLHALGISYFKLGNLKLSKAHFAAVLEIDPDDQEAKGLMDIMDKLQQLPGNSDAPSD